MSLFGFSRFWLQFLSQNLWLILGCFVLAFVLAYLLYRRTYPPLKKGKKTFLFVLRVLAIFFLFLAFSNTLLFFSGERVEEPVILVLVDNSRSMTLASGERSRKEIVEELVVSDALKDLETRSEVLSYALADTIRPFDLKDALLDFSGEITPIGAALRQVKEDFQGKNLEGILLVSDGAHNFGEDPLEVAKSLGFPLYTCGVGQPTSFKDVLIQNVSFPDLVYLGEKNQVKVFLSNQGFEGAKLPLMLKQKDKILDQKNVVLAASGQTQEIDLELLADQEGIFTYEVIIPPQEGELLPGNNKRSFSLRVLKSKMNVLCVAGKLSWEYSFLKRFLSSQEDISLQTVVYGARGRLLSDEFPGSREKLNEFDLLIFIDTPGVLLRPHAELIKETLREKPALVLLGEDMIRWRDFSPFNEIMPLEMKTVSVSRLSYNLKLTEAGRFHPVTALSDDPFENLSLWSNLPPFLGIIGLGDLKSGAKALAEYTDPGGQSLPGIVVAAEASTKVMVVLAFPFWRWDFWLWGVGKDNQAYQRLWRNSIRWLTTPQDLDRFTVKTSKLVYKSGEPIEFEARLYDESYQKIIDAFVEVGIRSANLEDSIALSLRLGEAGDYYGKLGSLPPGEYDFQCMAKKDEKTKNS